MIDVIEHKTVTKSHAKKLICALLLLGMIGIPSLRAQDYSKQFEGFQKAIMAKNVTALQPFISSEMAIPPMVTKEQLVPELLERILKDVFEKINTITLKETKAGEMTVFYDFIDPASEDRESLVLFDEDDKIKEIKVIAELIQEAQERRRGQNAEQPIADEFTEKYSSKKVEITTSDSRVIVGALYEIGENYPIILLCHQSGSNKYEYADIAPKLNNMGFNAFAVDLTGGGTFAAHQNETVDRGEPIGNSISDRQLVFNRLKEEINTAVDYLYKRYQQKVIIWGSSYSANYAISIISKNENTKAGISFSGLANGLSSILSNMEKPLFMTSSKEEVPRIKELLKGSSNRVNITHFIPNSKGGHGSSVLWNGQPFASEYWVALRVFLNSLK